MQLLSLEHVFKTEEPVVETGMITVVPVQLPAQTGIVSTFLWSCLLILDSHFFRFIWIWELEYDSKPHIPKD